MPARAFLALDITSTIRDALAGTQRQLDAPDAKIKWVAAENLHVTVKFLGGADDDQVAEVCAAAGEVAGGIAPFQFDVRGIQVVPPRGRARMIWAGIDDPTAGMTKLFERLEPALAALGFQPETRGFKPHVTLGRVKFVRDHDRLRQAAEVHADQHFGSVDAAEVVVYSSNLTPRGPIYTPLAKSALGGA